MTLAQKFIAHALRNATDKDILSLPLLGQGQNTIILLTASDTGEQFWLTCEQRDFELARRAAARGTADA